MEDKFEKLGQLIDSIDSLVHGMNTPMPSDFHMKMLKKLLPEKVKQLKESFVEITGEDPWGDN